VTIVHFTPHLPPDQAANALLPFHLGEWARARGDAVHFIAHPPASDVSDAKADVTWIPRTERTLLQRVFRTGSIAGAIGIRRDATPILRQADVVHVHSNGLLAEVGAGLAKRLGKPVVLTLYGTEIWHYTPKRLRPDLFTRAYREADAVTFYSQRLLDRANEIGLARPACHVIYPPVASSFAYHDADAQHAIREAFGITERHLLVNVKRLHPLAGQRYLIEAMKTIVARQTDTRLVICGTGPLSSELRAVARSNGVERHITFAGLVENSVVAQYCAAADLFVLPSVLEALPTVAVEALACGTPVVSADNPGGVELHGVFGEDVRVVPRENPGALATAILQALAEGRRTLHETARTIQERFRGEAVAREYWKVYAAVVNPHGS
jgi:glycosyltransferase involved in cell wall biosynthesis